MPEPHPSRDKVLKWLAADPSRSSSEASRKFGVPEGTVRSWKKRGIEKQQIADLRSNLTVFSTSAGAGTEAADPELSALAGQPIKVLLRRILGLRLARLALRVDADESAADSARIIASLADRLGAIEGLDEVKEQDPTSEEGRTALREALKGIPRDILLEVLAS